MSENESKPHYVITISREFGSLGRPVAKRTAEIQIGRAHV